MVELFWTLTSRHHLERDTLMLQELEFQQVGYSHSAIYLGCPSVGCWKYILKHADDHSAANGTSQFKVQDIREIIESEKLLPSVGLAAQPRVSK